MGGGILAHISENSRAGSDSDSGFRQEQVSDVRIFLGSQASPSVHLTDREINPKLIPSPEQLRWKETLLLQLWEERPLIPSLDPRIWGSPLSQ